MLHGVDDTGSVVSVTERKPQSRIRAIRDSGHEIVRRSDLRESARDALTFDDGFLSVAKVAEPMLRPLGAPATLFLTTGHIGKDNRWPGHSDLAPRSR